MADTPSGGPSRRPASRSASGSAGGDRGSSTGSGRRPSPRGAQKGAQKRPQRRERQGDQRDARGRTKEAAGAAPGESPGGAGAGPAIDDGVTWHDLDRQTRAALRSLPKEMAERVGAHLAMAGLLVDDDPERAREHTDVARRLAGRVAVVREACALTAYACGDFDAALQELRAYRRMSGDQTHLPLMADCERGLGRPERALEIAASPEAQGLPDDVARELRIVVAGARCDLGQPEAALALLGGDPLLNSRTPSGAEASAVRLRYAYADVLEQLGRHEESARWFAEVAAADTDGITDASDRVTPAQGSTGTP